MESELFKSIEEYLRQGESIPGLILMAAASLFEYVFPPFPGDTVVLLGAFLAAWASWSPWKVLAVTLAGALGGAWIDTIAGRFLRDYITGKKEFSPKGHGRLLAFIKRPSFQRGIKKIIDKFNRYGAPIILLNRFFPGIRALFFVGAGMASIPMWKVLLLGGISAMLWNAAIFIAGFQIGNNWEALLSLFRTYTKVVYIIIGAALLLFIASVVFGLLRKRK